MIASDDTSGENQFAEAMQTVSPTSTDDFISGDVMENRNIFKVV